MANRQAKTKRQERGRHSHQKGIWSETLAVLVLRLKGYRILARRVPGYKGSGIGELDIVARRGRSLIFVEVKYRHNLKDGLAAISGQQRKRLIHGAELFLKKHSMQSSGYDDHHPSGGKFDGMVRFDVVVIAPWRWPLHVKNAFGANEAMGAWL